jgi:hypothetical protein
MYLVRFNSSWKSRFVACATIATLLMTNLGGLALANDLSDYPCTAGDVEIIGSGTVVNEPCSCTAGGTFNARVQFTVRNNTSTGRYCIALHLVPDGSVISQPVDVVLVDANGSSTAPGKSGSAKFKDTIMFGTIPNFPCNQGAVCFGEAGVVRGKCLPGKCTTISWNTSPGNASCTTADETPPGGQCRHQQVCVLGFGATLACTANCNVVCGSTSTLQACVTAPTTRGPFSMKVQGDDGSTSTQSAFGDESGTTCLNFTVAPTKSPKTTYTLTVTDKDGCTRTATTTVNVTATTMTLTPPTTAPCNGLYTVTASANFSACSFAWTIDGVSLATFLAGGAADDARVARVTGTGSNTLTFRALDGACHTIGATASCTVGTQTPCAASATLKVKQCVGAGQACTTP